MESIKIDLLNYKIFEKLSYTLNFRQAAKELNTSISIVSKKIKALENHYGTTQGCLIKIYI